MSKKNKTIKRGILYQLGIRILAFALVMLILPETISITRVWAAESIKLNKTKITIEVGKAYTLKLSGTKEKATWASSNKKIAKINQSGKVTGVKKGSATITATVDGKKYTCKVTIKQGEYKVPSKGLAEVKTHQEIMNDLNMTVIKTFTKVTGVVGTYSPEREGTAIATPIYGEIPNLVEIKLGYFTDRNKIKHYIVAITNTSKEAFDDGKTLSYPSEDDMEYTLLLKYIQPGETRFYMFGNSNEKGWGYLDYEYFKGLKFYLNDFQKTEEYEDIRKYFQFNTKESKELYGSSLYMEVESHNHEVEDYDSNMTIFYIDGKGKLYDVINSYTNKENTRIYIDIDKEIPSKVMVAVNYMVRSTILQIDNIY